MIYILIISLLIKKPFYLLRRQSFSFEIVSEFSNFMSRGWGFWLPILSRGKGFCTQLLSRGEGFCSLRVVSRGFVPGGGGMVLDEIDTCITWLSKQQNVKSSEIPLLSSNSIQNFKQIEQKTPEILQFYFFHCLAGLRLWHYIFVKMRLETYKMATSIFLKFPTSKCDISRIIWLIFSSFFTLLHLSLTYFFIFLGGVAL